MVALFLWHTSCVNITLTFKLLNMKTQKHQQQLDQFSAIFLQLGFIFALFMTYVILEHKTVKKYSVFVNYQHTSKTDFFIEPPTNWRFVKKVVKPVSKPKVNVTLPPVVKPQPHIITIVPPKTPVVQRINKTKTTNPILPIPTKPQKPVVKHTMKSIEDVPVFPGCKGSNEAKRACFESKIRKFVARKYNADIGYNLHSKTKKIKVRVIFKISKTGDIEILKMYSRYSKLKKEAMRVVNKLPKMTPGKVKGKPVAVIYSLPIIVKSE